MCELVATTGSEGAVFLRGCGEAGGGWAALVPVGREEWVGGCWCSRRGIGPLKAPVLTGCSYLPVCHAKPEGFPVTSQPFLLPVRVINDSVSSPIIPISIPSSI